MRGVPACGVVGGGRGGMGGWVGGWWVGGGHATSRPLRNRPLAHSPAPSFPAPPTTPPTPSPHLDGDAHKAAARREEHALARLARRAVEDAGQAFGHDGDGLGRQQAAQRVGVWRVRVGGRGRGAGAGRPTTPRACPASPPPPLPAPSPSHRPGGTLATQIRACTVAGPGGRRQSRRRPRAACPTRGRRSARPTRGPPWETPRAGTGPPGSSAPA